MGRKIWPLVLNSSITFVPGSVRCSSVLSLSSFTFQTLGPFLYWFGWWKSWFKHTMRQNMCFSSYIFNLLCHVIKHFIEQTTIYITIIELIIYHTSQCYTLNVYNTTIRPISTAYKLTDITYGMLSPHFSKDDILHKILKYIWR